MHPQIILASQSPRRKQLLEWAEINFEIIIQPTDESFSAALPPAEIAMHIAANKALAVKKNLSPKDERIILGADTIVVLENKIIGKPENTQDAINILQSLSGKQHEVITGVVLLQDDKQISFSDSTFVQFHPLTAAQIEYYIHTYKPYDKAGAYAIQEWIGVVGIHSIQGDFYNVMGLPVSRVLQALNKL